jgi:hypothetical protein
MSLYDRPYERDVVRADLDVPVVVRFDRQLLDAVASEDATARRGLEGRTPDPEGDPDGVWSTTTAARQCDELRDFEAACGVAFENELEALRASSEETGEINALLGPVRAALMHDGPSRPALQRAVSQYSKGLWDEARASLDEALDLEPASAEAWLLKAQVAVRAHDERAAGEAAHAARQHTEPGTDVRLYSVYILAWLALRAGQEEDVLDVAREQLGPLGAEQGVGLWSRAAEPIARDLAFITLKACGRLATAGQPLPFPTVYDRARALLSRNPAAGLRLAADADLLVCHDELLRAVHDEHEHVRREVEDMLNRWDRSIDDDDSEAAAEVRRQFQDEARLARARIMGSLLSACDARSRIRALSPDATRGPFAQRAWVSEMDAPSPLDAAVTASPVAPAEDSAAIRWRRDIELKRQAAEEAAQEGTHPVIREVEAELAREADTTPWATMSLVAFAVALAVAVAPGLHEAVGDPLVNTGMVVFVFAGVITFGMAVRRMRGPI